MECEQCPKTFARPEHLRRHQASVHSEESFACEVCGKKFNRNDSCKRHEASAHGRSNDNFIVSNGIRRRVRRACTQCAAARTKCSGSPCCSRCQKRGLVCQYLAATGPGSKSNDDTRPTHNLEGGDTIVVASDVEAAVMPGPQNGADTARAETWAQNDLFPPDTNMEYMWNEQTNWLPVADGFDMLVEFAASSYPAVDAWNRTVVPNVPPLEPSLTSPPPSISTSGVSSSIDSRRRADLSYANGHGARGSLQDAPREAHEASTVDDADLRPVLDLDFPDMASSVPANLDVPNAVYVDATCCQTLLWHFELLCCRDSSFYTRFVSSRFPPIEYLSYCLTIYQETFQKHLAFVHCSSLWYEQNGQWLLILAAIAMGSSFDRSQHGSQCRVAFTEFFRRAVGHAFETGTQVDPLPFAQACLHLAVAKSSHSTRFGSGAIMNEANAAWEMYLQQYRMVQLGQIDGSQTELRWRAWIAEQSHIRLLWSKWLLQTMLALFKTSDFGISLPMEDLPLPCNDDLWEATTAEAWEALLAQSPVPTGMSGHRSALYQLYTRHKLQEKLGSAEKLALTYCVLSRTTEVARSLRHPLYAWSPAPAREPGSESGREGEGGDANETQQHQWLPANPVYAAWRNSACDCLDILHWQANAETAVDRGFEAPIILHLHASRLLLLCPCETLIYLCEQLSTRRPSAGSAGQLLAGNADPRIVKWLTLDDHKGRLSMVHAGAVFWHIRRYSCGMFYEPFTIFLSAVIIVAYGIFLPQVHGALMRIKESTSQARVHPNSGGRGVDSDEDDYVPHSILVDRPCDDEMVQIFVRRGHKMRVEMSRAGDICLPQGQRIVLDEAIKLLRRAQYSSFDDSREYARLLQRLKQHILM